jgi:hypothetical protein
MRNSYKILVGKPRGRNGSQWDNNIPVHWKNRVNTATLQVFIWYMVRQLVGCSNHSNKLLGSVKLKILLDQLCDYKFFMKTLLCGVRGIKVLNDSNFSYNSPKKIREFIGTSLSYFHFHNYSFVC